MQYDCILCVFFNYSMKSMLYGRSHYYTCSDPIYACVWAPSRIDVVCVACAGEDGPEAAGEI